MLGIAYGHMETGSLGMDWAVYDGSCIDYKMLTQRDIVTIGQEVCADENRIRVGKITGLPIVVADILAEEFKDQLHAVKIKTRS